MLSLWVKCNTSLHKVCKFQIELLFEGSVCMCVSNVTLPYTKYVNFKLNFYWKDLCVCVCSRENILDKRTRSKGKGRKGLDP